MSTKRKDSEPAFDDLDEGNRPERPWSDVHDLKETERSSGELRKLVQPSSDLVLDALLRLSRAGQLELGEESLARRYLEVLGELFPERRLLIRLRGSGSGPTSFVLLQGANEPLATRLDAVELSEEAIARHQLPPQNGWAEGVHTVPDYRPYFEPTAVGFDVPLLHDRVLLGILVVEYEVGRAEPEGDRSLILQLALHLGAAIRNARLLRQSHSLRGYLEKLLDHASAPIVVIGQNRQLRSVNQAFLALTGRPRDELEGRDFVALLPEEERRRLLPVFVNAVRGRATTNFELRIPRQDGSLARLVFNIASVLSADREVEAVIAIGRDLTEIRELQDQVIQAEKLATLGQLAAGVVHELNNPLTSISVYSEYLLKKHQAQGGDPSDAEKLRRVVDSAARILRFSRDLVAYARPSGEEPERVSIHAVLDQSVVFCEHVLHRANSVILKRYGEGIPSIVAIKSQLHQVFINLITNACHAVGGKGVLTIETRVANGYVVIHVDDNGPGVPPEFQERIFEPFFSTKLEGKGTGLGLSIVRNIVSHHQGKIHVEPAPGGGTRFVVRLPLP
ncbi:MAG: ATP-binding protein [Myxococcota bacterium]